MSSEMLRQLEKNIQSQKKLVDLGESLERLKTNRDFKRLVLDGYLEQEAIRLVHMKAHPQFQSEDAQKSIDTQINAIGSLVQYFNAVAQQAGMAARSVASDEATRAELLQEEE